jgi:hypothetical protein
VSKVQKVAVCAGEFGGKQSKKDRDSESEPEMSKKTQGPGEVTGNCRLRKVQQFQDRKLLVPIPISASLS